jgi:hypothetical protein
MTEAEEPDTPAQNEDAHASGPRAQSEKGPTLLSTWEAGATSPQKSDPAAFAETAAGKAAREAALLEAERAAIEAERDSAHAILEQVAEATALVEQTLRAILADDEAERAKLEADKVTFEQAQRTIDALAEASALDYDGPIATAINRLATLGIVVDLKSARPHPSDTYPAGTLLVDADISRFQAALERLSGADWDRRYTEVGIQVKRLVTLGIVVEPQSTEDRAAAAERAPAQKPLKPLLVIHRIWRRRSRKDPTVLLKDVAREYGTTARAVSAAKSRQLANNKYRAKGTKIRPNTAVESDETDE